MPRWRRDRRRFRTQVLWSSEFSISAAARCRRARRGLLCFPAARLYKAGRRDLQMNTGAVLPFSPAEDILVSSGLLPSSESDPLRQGVDTLRGVTELRREQLERLGILTVGDLLFHFPRAYEDLTDYRPITGLTAGTIQTVRGEVVEIPDGRYLPDGRCIISVVISDDGKHCVDGVWF